MVTANEKGTAKVDKLEAHQAKCPHCGKVMEVGLADPLQMLECSSCRKTFVFLEEFGDFHLQKAFERNGKNSCFLADYVVTGTQSIVLILGNNALAEPDAIVDFQRETQRITSSCSKKYVSSVSIGEVQGLPYFALKLLPEVDLENVLKEIGFTLPSAPSMENEEADLQRAVFCPQCGVRTDVADYNPLDEVNCKFCHGKFILLPLLGNCEIKSHLDVGGTSMIYRAWHRKMKKEVALKVLSALEMKRNPVSAKSFLRVFQLTQPLNHPNIVEKYECGSAYGFHYMVMELLDGVGLSDILAQHQKRAEDTILSAGKSRQTPQQGPFHPDSQRAIPEIVCLEIALQSAAALGMVHRHNLVHGDFKPENIMITEKGVVKVFDFGLVQFVNAEKLLAEGESFSVYGTPMYIPPERVRGEPEDFRSDLYGLGATLFHFLSGLPPFHAEDATDLAIMHAETALPPFKTVAPWVSDITCRIIDKSMKKNVADRYSSHLEFVADLTLARNLLIQKFGKKDWDGKRALREFVKSLEFAKKKKSAKLEAPDYKKARGRET